MPYVDSFYVKHLNAVDITHNGQKLPNMSLEQFVKHWRMQARGTKSIKKESMNSSKLVNAVVNTGLELHALWKKQQISYTEVNMQFVLPSGLNEINYPKALC